MVWRPVLAGKATLSEIENHYSLVDLARLNDLLDLIDGQERRAIDKVKEAQR